MSYGSQRDGINHWCGAPVFTVLGPDNVPFFGLGIGGKSLLLNGGKFTAWKIFKDCVAHFSFTSVFKERPTQLLKKRLIFFLLLPFPWMLSTRKDGEYTLLINKDYTN